MTNCIEKQEFPSFFLGDVLADIRSGMSNEEIAVKYGLSPDVFQYQNKGGNTTGIVETTACSEPTLEQPVTGSPLKPVKEESEESSFICPTCLTSFASMFDICPNCSASVQETIVQPNENELPIAIEPPKSEHLLTQVSAVHDGATEKAKIEIIQSNRPVRDPGVPDQSAGCSVKQADSSGATSANSPDVGLPEGRIPEESKIASHTRVAPRATKPVNLQDRERRLASSPSLRCEGCKSTMTPALRDIYDRARSMHAVIGASVCFVFAFLCCIGLTFFEGPSLSRLTIFFLGSLFFLIGGVLTATGVFMYLAREKVYFCPRCKRTYPRADISYLTAALVWSSKRAIGSL